MDVITWIFPFSLVYYTAGTSYRSRVVLIRIDIVYIGMFIVHIPIVTHLSFNSPIPPQLLIIVHAYISIFFVHIQK